MLCFNTVKLFDIIVHNFMKQNFNKTIKKKDKCYKIKFNAVF